MSDKKMPPTGNVPAAPRTLIGDRHDHLLQRIEGETDSNISACYQCERCTNACPVSYYMDVKPHQVIRYVQLGWREELYQSTTIWVCLSCEMCTTYCPNEVSVAETILHLRSLAARSTVVPREKQLAVFHQVEEQDWQLLAIYHSHLQGPEQPSPTDIAEAYYPELVNLIWSNITGAWICRGFSIQKGRVNPVPVFRLKVK